MCYQDAPPAPPLTIEAAEIASGLRIPKTAILRTRAGIQDHPLLRGLPEPLMTRPRLVWLRADINAWIESRRTFLPDTDTDTPAPNVAPAAGAPRKRGRPRKSARAAEKGGE